MDLDPFINKRQQILVSAGDENAYTRVPCDARSCRGDQVVALESIDLVDWEAVSLQRLLSKVDLVVERGLGGRTIRLVRLV